MHFLIKFLYWLSHRLNFLLLLSVFLLHFFVFCGSTLFVNLFCLFPLWFFFFKLHFLEPHFFLLLQNFDGVNVTLNIVLLSNFCQSINFVHYVFSQNSILFSHFHCVLDFVINRVDLFNNNLILFSQTGELGRGLIFLCCMYVQHAFHSFVRSFLLVF